MESVRFCGSRLPDGRGLVVEWIGKDGSPLPSRYDLYCYDTTGFEWGWKCPSGKQLALALLAAALGDGDAAIEACNRFDSEVITHLAWEGWTLTAEAIFDWWLQTRDPYCLAAACGDGEGGRCLIV